MASSTRAWDNGVHGYHGSCGHRPRRRQPVTSHDVATLTRGDLTVATAGLRLAEAHQIVSGVQQHLVAAQATAAVEDAGQCETCGRPLAHKDGRTIVLRSLFGTLRIPSPRLKTYLQLPGKVVHDHPRHVQRVLQEQPQIAHRAHLQGEPEPAPLAPP